MSLLIGLLLVSVVTSSLSLFVMRGLCEDLQRFSAHPNGVWYRAGRFIMGALGVVGIAVTVIVVTVTCARADDTVAKPATATVSTSYDGAPWKPGRLLAVCVQTGLRKQGISGAFTLEYSFVVKSDARVGTWADVSYVLMDESDNLIAIASDMVRGGGADQVKERAVNGENLLPGDRPFERVCGELSGTTVIFTPREPKK